MAHMEKEDDISRNGLAARIILTIVIVAAFLAGSLIYVAFYSAGYSALQKAVVVLVALIAAGSLISILWVLWAASYKKHFGS